jgi:predicted DNA-binding transcriptional regulator YafY
MVSRTSRLFMLLDALRGHRRPITATRLAEVLSVSERTIYRDIGTLIELGAPIEGEAGIGYVLRAGFFLPPLMFTEDELEALVLGARWVERQGDTGLARAAGTALAKIATASPRDLRDCLADAGLWAPMLSSPSAAELPLQPIREAIRREHKLRIAYVNETGESSEAAWCELRNGFRHFRADRIACPAMTLADISLATPLMTIATAKLPVTQFKHLHNWFARIQARESWQRTARSDW